ncbi:MAG: hypothetical protein ABFD90_01940 [Phycisphaerales bacterium]
MVAVAVTPARADVAQTTMRFLPKPEGLTTEDGAAFYKKAVQTLPANLDKDRLDRWIKGPLNELPLDQAQVVLDQAKGCLDLVGQGARCKNCNWPPFVAGMMPANLSEYRQVCSLLRLKARVEIARSQYGEAIRTTGTGLAMAKHIGEAPTVIQGMVGVAIASVMLRCVDDMAQVKDTPNLYSALHALPRPLIDLNVPISSEMKNLETSTQYKGLVKSAMRDHLEDSHVAVRRLMNRLDGTVTALECIEVLRHYAAGHNGQLPAQLNEITDLQVPNDPATDKPFAYRIEGSKAVLEVSAPKGGTLRDTTRYEITVAR